MKRNRIKIDNYDEYPNHKLLQLDITKLNKYKIISTTTKYFDKLYNRWINLDKDYPLMGFLNKLDTLIQLIKTSPIPPLTNKLSPINKIPLADEDWHELKQFKLVPSKPNEVVNAFIAAIKFTDDHRITYELRYNYNKNNKTHYLNIEFLSCWGHRVGPNKKKDWYSDTSDDNNEPHVTSIEKLIKYPFY